MCGIAGFYGFKDDDLIKTFSQQLEHRGPDGEGLYFDGENVTLLNRRLAIIDRKGGDQPIYNEDKNIVVVYNGEIYNFQELRRELEKKKHRFTTNSDTEVIAHGYEEWGEDCFDRFNGMFGIALYDKKKKKLLLARDHFGIKPLYFTTIGKNRIIFSSELRPIIHSGLIKKIPNDKVIYRYLRFRVHDDSKETFFKNVYKLMPGELLTIEKGKTIVRAYSDLKSDLLSAAKKKYERGDAKEFRQKLIDSIKMRLVSEVPVGTSFSGGLDSSSVVGIIHDLLKKKDSGAEAVGAVQNTFSAVFPNSSNNEEEYIDELIADKHEIECHKVYPTAEVFFEELEDFVKTQEEPTISTGPYAQYKVMKEAKKYVTVLLDGQGADEEMAGYLPYYLVYLKELKRKGNYGKLLWESLMAMDVIRYFVSTKIAKKTKVTGLLSRKFAEQYKDETFSMTNDDLKKRLVEDIFHNSLPSLLRYEDKNSMRYSVEGRVPFLDFNLLRFIFSLSSDAIIKNGWNKYILRKAVRGYIPKSIARRRNKIGFTTPESEWFLRMKNRIYGVFLSESFTSRPYVNQQEVIKSFQLFIEGKNDDTMLFWRLLNLEIWLRLFIDKEQSPVVKEKKVSPSIKVGNKTYLRTLIKTEVFEKGTDYVNKIVGYVTQSINKLSQKKKWFVVVSEKAIAVSQGRSYFLWEIKPSFFAKFLSKFVKRTPYGIGLGSPWTMELALREAGIVKILAATVVSALTKPFGVKGVFYQVAGREVASIDGPTEYSLYPSNVSAKLGPKDPRGTAEEITEAIKLKEKDGNFDGVVIIDANDLGRDILTNTTSLKDKEIEEIFRDNPMGQGREQTPITVVSF